MPLREVLELDEAQIAQTVLAERVSVFTDRAISAAITSPLGTILLAWFQAPVTGWPRAVAWLCLINPVLLLMIGIGYRVRLARSRGEDALPWARWMIFVVSLAGLGWGSTVWFFWTEGQYLYYMLDLLVLVGVAGMDVIIMSPFRIATVLFTGGVVLPPMLHLALVQNPFSVQIAAGLTVLFVLALQHSRVAEKQLVEGLEYAVRNQAMARELAHRTVALKATQAELNRAQAVGSVGSWVGDIAANTMRLSAEACRILGLPEGTTENFQSYLARTNPEDRDAANRAWQEALKGAAFDHEHRIVIENEIRWVRQKAAFKYAADGSPLSAEGAVQDISDRKQADQALRQSEERYRSLIEWSPEPLAVHRGGKLIYVNPAAIKVFGATSAQDLVGTPILDRIHPDFRQIVMARVKSAAPNGGTTPPLEEKYLKLDGTVIDLEVEGTSIIYDGEPAIQASMRDITERKHAEAALQQEHARLLETERELLNAHESLAEADRLESVGRLAAGVAHEVKNPLTIIRLGVDYLSKQLSQESNQAVLDKVRGAIDRADNVIGDLLGFSRQKPFARRPTNINEVIDNAIHLIKHEIERRNIVIIRNRDDLMPPIFADPDRLVQVFINLLTNAAQAIGGDGSIEIVTRSIRLSEHDLEHAETSMFRLGEPLITVDIRDNGPGISAENEKKLFEPFFTTKPMGEGSGLGLAVSRNIVIMHRGSISISNRPEGGASALLMFRVDRGHLTNEKANTGSR